MSKKQIEVLERDDEVLREHGMVSGAVKAGRWELRPTCAPEVSWMQFNGVIVDDNGLDVMWRTSAFAFIHSAPRPEVLGCVRNRDAFIKAVDEWMIENNPKHGDIRSLSSAMNERVGEWFSSSSETATSGPSMGN